MGKQEVIMATRRIEAIYQDGVFKPLAPVGLAENERVTLLLQEASDSGPAPQLFGAFPALAALTDDDLAWAEQALNRSLERQLRLLDEQNPGE
jgi:hypothetical protein